MKGERRESDYIGMDPVRPTIDRSVALVVWVLAIYSTYLVVRYGLPVFFDLETTCRIMAVRTAEGMHSALGLTYSGVWGAILVACEVVGVVGALVLTRSREASVRRTALLMLLGWAFVWAGNVIWLERVSDWSHPMRTVLVAIAMIGAGAMVALRWERGVLGGASA